MKQILDVYPYNKFDLTKEIATGTDGVIIKLGQGGWSDYDHLKLDWIHQCQAANMPYGIYWLFDARYSPERHKAEIKRLFPDGYFGQLGFWLDVEKPVLSMPEWYYRRLPYAFWRNIESVIQGVLKMTDKVGIYTSISQWKLCAGIVPDEKEKWFATFPLWTAQYNAAMPVLYGAWKNWFMWQYQAEPDYSVCNDVDFDAWTFANSANVFSLGQRFDDTAKRLGDNLLTMNVSELHNKFPEVWKNSGV